VAEATAASDIRSLRVARAVDPRLFRVSNRELWGADETVVRKGSFQPDRRARTFEKKDADENDLKHQQTNKHLSHAHSK